MKSITNRKCIVFDLDYTLYDEHDYFYQVFNQFCKKINRVDLVCRMSDYFKVNRISSKDIFKDVLIYCNLTYKLKIFRDLLYDIYLSLDANVLIYDDADSILKWCREKEIKTGVLTNGIVEAQRNKVRCLGLESLVDNVFFARELGEGVEKPEVKPFAVTASLLKLDGSEIVFVGDNPRTDFVGAKAIDAFTVRLLRGVNASLPSSEYIDKQIDDLNQLKGVF